ncbi:toll-like receptor 13 [Contarinia nasturtii]|uniref:toll-like receptor 13 n=1 Tax=Contarinia nasturtii TaxID=265458 RepID=UPI0012D4143F|nr:toll-like receptor 13 [Contarinia nasturtii]XP_031631325.1 toll-like receptor 13 [Contarinia nasturtii]XP_031631326.1 toll-like receptor 13 [Contarinia nasturtii]XP_031631327.1 toll-like receptor 13 [Contarinia nasturtii]
MRLLWTAVTLICTINFVHGKTNNGTGKIEICDTCLCNVNEKYLNCADQNLYKLFEAKDWDALISANKTAVLDKVEFKKNGIEVITIFPKLDIRSLSFQHNKIRQIEDRAFFNLTTLERLDLSDNKLTREALQSKVFEGHYDSKLYEPLTNLKWLNLASNDLHTLDLDLFDHFPNLETLILAHNQFRILDGNTVNAISGIPKLQVLDMSAMELKEIPSSLFHGPRNTLKVLNLTGNLLTEIPDALHYAANLVELVLDDLLIEHIGGNYSRLPKLNKLEKLSISFMRKLQTIEEGAFSGLPALREFNCQSNLHLNSIHPHSFNSTEIHGNSSGTNVDWPPIQSLILYSNNLSVISKELILYWKEIDEIDIRYNPWKCACENQWMVNELIPMIKEKSKKNPSLYEDIKCDHPIEMKGRSFDDLNLKHVGMRCEDYYGRRPERDGPILVGIFIGILIGIPVTMAALFLYRRGCFGIFGYRPNPADYGRAFYKRTELREDLHI